MGKDSFITKVYEDTHFIFLSCNSTSSKNGLPYYNPDDLTRLEEYLEGHKDKRCFVFVHVFFTDRSGNYGNLYGNRLRDDEIKTLIRICDLYPNSIWFSGHSHWAWKHQGEDDTVARSMVSKTYGSSKGRNYESNIYPSNSTSDIKTWCIHLPATGIPRDPEDVDWLEDSELESEFAIVDVYENYIQINGFTLTSGDPTTNPPIYKRLPIATYLLKSNI